MKNFFFLFCFFLFTSAQSQTKIFTAQVLVVGGGTGGTAAGIQAARSGANTIIVEQTNMLGGMLTAAGVSCTDGNDSLLSGIWQEFREALYKHYGTRNLGAGWVSNTCFEPHTGDSIFKSWAAKEKNLKVYYGWYFDKALRNGNKVTGASFINSRNERMNVFAQIVIDATELGDVFADAGADYDLGMDNPKKSGEEEAVEKNDIIQDLTWAAVLKDYGKDADKTIEQPAGYDAKKYYCSTSDAPCNEKPYSLNTQKVLDYGRLTAKDTIHAKYMLNWPVHGNDFYINAVELKTKERDAAYEAARQQTLGFIYFLQTQLGFKNIGLADDELSKGMALIPYNREGRRVKGAARLTINQIKNPYNYTLYRTGISVGDYPVDHHHGQYPGKVPGIKFPEVPSFNIPLGTLIPEKIEGLIICEKGISVSSIANGTTRLQPAVLLTGQAAGILAASCIKKEIQPRNASVREIQNELLKNNCYIMPFCDVYPNDDAWQAVQFIGSTGIIRGTGKSIDWENKTYFYPAMPLKKPQFIQNIKEALGCTLPLTGNDAIDFDEMKNFCTQIRNYVYAKTGKQIPADDALKNISSSSFHAALTNKDAAVILYAMGDVWKLADYDMKGNIVFRVK